MAGVDPPVGLDAERVRNILAPFGEGPTGLTVTLEAATGGVIAASPDGATDGRAASSAAVTSPSVTRELRLDGALVGRLVVAGPAVGDPAVCAAVEALAVAVEHMVDAERRVAVGATASGGVEPSSTLATELAIGRQQQRTFVSLLAPDVDGFDLASHYEPARDLGGDFFELFRLPRRGRPLGIVIADVAGKGIGAAVLMAFSRPVIHSALSAAPGPAVALERTNRVLTDELHTALFVTALVGRLDVRTGHLRLANAGHEPPLFVPGDGGPIHPVEGGGPLMGVFSPLDLEEVELVLRPGDHLVLYTDGVTDAQAPSGERFGKNRLVEAIESVRGLTAHDLVAAIRDSVASFRQSVEPVDDVTIVAVGRHGATVDTGGA